MTIETFLAIWFGCALLTIMIYSKLVGPAGYGNIARAIFWGPIAAAGVIIALIYDFIMAIKGGKD